VFLRKIKWAIIILLLILIAAWLYIRHDNKDFLRYGVLHIDKFPNSLKIIDCESAGWTDQQYEYYISIDSVELNKLFSGRKYTKENNIRSAIPSAPDTFPANICYTSGELKNGLVTIFVNKDRTRAYIIYDIN
jgi:hypothetical protein